MLVHVDVGWVEINFSLLYLIPSWSRLLVTKVSHTWWDIFELRLLIQVNVSHLSRRQHLITFSVNTFHFGLGHHISIESVCLISRTYLFFNYDNSNDNNNNNTRKKGKGDRKRSTRSWKNVFPTETKPTETNMMTQFRDIFCQNF